VLCIDSEGMGANRETSVNPKQNRVLSKCMLFFYIRNIGEPDEQNILKLELALFRLKRNVSRNK
jgi:hypothetical protein